MPGVFQNFHISILHFVVKSKNYFSDDDELEGESNSLHSRVVKF